ncbi:FAD-dependent oxidoreductase [Mesorhizobium sp. YR577]|uniref:dihydrolipoyl dehydrogenase family protein n=1 Tax=Mesorhizobium sp. YR577 TaxID=1884373 RepID=UPI0008E30EE3|nr:FAD-dependent oxidoreductase [Mesorhizobium sp. YR577]SFU12455.1 Pyruvate/2-oxoglutarate dehydrogenase complex, dihydrolipoamide dehydrogenase (E3) component [Mesorhizobium sp. YR577]
MTQTLTPDICVIGAGSGGLSVAAAAAAFGVHVVLIEKGKMGGDCLNYGCVPSKALIAAAKQAHAMRNGAGFGIAPVEPEIDFEAVHRHIHEVIASIAPNDSVGRFAALGVHVIQAEARFRDARTVIAGDVEIRARRFVVATGSSPLIPPIPGLDSTDYVTNETIFDLTQRPGHLVIIGGGPIGMELAQAYRRLGSDVTVIEAERALGKEDPEVSAVALAHIRAEGVDIREGAKVTRVESLGEAGVRLFLETAAGAKKIEGSHVLLAAGRSANVAGLDLDKAGILFDQKGIKVDDTLRSSNRRVYAVGDVAGSLQFTHVANYHAGLVIRAMLFRLSARENLDIIPRVTFTDPEIAHVGLSEAEAAKKQKTIRVLRWPYAENDRAQAERKTHGHIKLVTDGRGKILGVSIVGSGAGEMINFWSLALSKKLGVRDIAGFVAPYPTMGEIGKRAAITYFTPATRKKLVRRLIAFLRYFG